MQRLQLVRQPPIPEVRILYCIATVYFVLHFTPNQPLSAYQEFAETQPRPDDGVREAEVQAELTRSMEKGASAAADLTFTEPPGPSRPESDQSRSMLLSLRSMELTNVGEDEAVIAAENLLDLTGPLATGDMVSANPLHVYFLCANVSK